jgi:hypothetical protein
VFCKKEAGIASKQGVDPFGSDKEAASDWR